MQKDLRDCLIYSYTISNYVGSSVKKLVTSMRQNPINEEDIKYNGEKLIQILQEIGLQTHFQSNDLVNPSIREQMLFICQLFHSLPHYQAKGEPIVFSCCLMEEVQKYIELINNTNKAINYWVKYDGSNDFVKESDSVTIAPRSLYRFKIKYVARLSKQVEGVITFTNKKESNTQAAALVFQLVSNITERKSMQTLKTKSKLYQLKEEKIIVKNIFSNSQ